MSILSFLRPKLKVTIKQGGQTYSAKGPEGFMKSLGGGAGKIVIDMDSDTFEMSGPFLNIVSVKMGRNSINGYNITDLELEKVK